MLTFCWILWTIFSTLFSLLKHFKQNMIQICNVIEMVDIRQRWSSFQVAILWICLIDGYIQPMLSFLKTNLLNMEIKASDKLDSFSVFIQSFQLIFFLFHCLKNHPSLSVGGRRMWSSLEAGGCNPSMTRGKPWMDSLELFLFDIGSVNETWRLTMMLL